MRNAIPVIAALLLASGCGQADDGAARTDAEPTSDSAQRPSFDEVFEQSFTENCIASGEQSGRSRAQMVAACECMLGEVSKLPQAERAALTQEMLTPIALRCRENFDGSASAPAPVK